MRHPNPSIHLSTISLSLPNNARCLIRSRRFKSPPSSQLPNSPSKFRHDVPVPQASELRPGQCLVKLVSSGACHTDLHLSRDDWPAKAKTPLIGGHEGVGLVVAIAEHTEDPLVKVGQRVGIKWVVYTCQNCEHCRKGLEQNCIKAKHSGFSVNGTFGQYVATWIHTVTPIPDALDSFEAAPLLCAGVTVYRALKYSGAKIGDWVVLPGAGGGLGHLAVQYAVAMGMRVVAVDTGTEKKELCLELGAEKWIDFNETTDIVKFVQEAYDSLGPHCALVTSTHAAGYSQAINCVRPGDAREGWAPSRCDSTHILDGDQEYCISIKGSCAGNRQDSIEATELGAAGKVKVRYSIRPLSELQQVYDDLEEGKVVGRIVLDTSK